MKRLILTVAILIMFCSYSVYALDYAKVTAEGLRLRSSPNLESEIVKVMPFGTKAKIIGESEITERIDNIDANWYKLKLDDSTEGWAFGAYLELWAEGYEPELVWEAEIPESKEGVRGKQAMPRVIVNKFAEDKGRAKSTDLGDFPFKVVGNVAYGMLRDYLLYVAVNREITKNINLQNTNVKLSNNNKYLLCKTYEKAYS